MDLPPITPPNLPLSLYLSHHSSTNQPTNKYYYYIYEKKKILYLYTLDIIYNPIKWSLENRENNNKRPLLVLKSKKIYIGKLIDLLGNCWQFFLNKIQWFNFFLHLDAVCVCTFYRFFIHMYSFIIIVARLSPGQVWIRNV